MTTRTRLALVVLGLLVVPSLAFAQWETPSRAFHKAPVFPLEGRHLTVPCASCHIKGQVKGTPTTCADCHWVRRQDDLYKTRLGMDCEQCHRATSWTATKWDHATATGMPLNVAHKSLSCDSATRTVCSRAPISAAARATRRTIRPPRRRITRRRAFRRHASCATSRRTRRSPRAGSITTVPSSSSAPTQRWTARAAIATASTKARRATASAATATTTNGRRRPTTSRPVSRPTAPLAIARRIRASAAAELQSQQRLPARSARTPRKRVRAATRTASTRARPATASAATATTTSARPRRIMRRPATRRRVSRATGRRTRRGGRGPSITAACSRWSARTPRSLRHVPRQQRLQGHAARLRRLPSHRLPTDHGAQSRRGWLLDRLRLLSPADGSELRQRAPSTTTACSRSSARTPRRRASAATRAASTRARRATASAVITTTTSGPRHRTTRLPGSRPTCETCHRPTDATLAHGDLQPQQRVPARRHAHHANVRSLPREQRLQGHAAHVRRLSPRRLPADGGTQPRGRRLLDDLRHLPSSHRRHLARRDLRPQHGVPVARQARDRGLRRVPREQRLPGHAARRVSAAIARSTTAPPAPVTWPRGFPTTCEVCHRAADAAWTQGRFTHTWFPITSGKHSGLRCSDCHTDPVQLTSSSRALRATGARRWTTRTEGASGYAYDSNRCYSCHPDGRKP